MQNTDDFESTNGHFLRAKVHEIRVVTKGRARQLGTKAREHARRQLEGQREHLATRIDGVADTLMRHAEDSNHLQQAAELRLVHGVEAAASYLHSHPSDGVASNSQGFVLRHPLRSLFLALILGYLLGRFLS